MLKLAKIKNMMTILRRIPLYLVKGIKLIAVLIEAIYIIFRYGMHKNNMDPKNARHVQYFCRRLCATLNIQVQVHGEVPQQTALWASNHISFLDIPVLGSAGRVFFLSKAEIADWFLVGFLARSGGTLFIKRGSGDVNRVSEQMADYLRQDVPVVFFPEATTTNGEKVKRIYGKLFVSAIEAQKPIQIALICYLNAQGQLEKNIPFVDIGFVEHARNVFDINYKVQAHVKFLPPIDVTGHDVRSLTTVVQQQMEQGLAELQAQIITKSAE